MPASVDLTREEILASIAAIEDPEIGRTLTDLGMVKGARFDRGVATVEIQLLTPAYPHRDAVEGQLRAAVGALPEVTDVVLLWSHKVRPNGSGRSDAEAIKGVKNTIAVASGKGGVGKSTVAVNLACALSRSGATVGLLDTDVYGPSIPIMMGVTDKPLMRNQKMVPLEAFGVKLMSIGFLLDPEKALIWRGPLVAQLITQFLNDVDWGDLDYLVMDLPPGTGDVQLTLAQKVPISGAVIVTTPQEVALADAKKGLKMFQEVKTPILGIVENMSYFVCPSCDERHTIFGEGGGARIAAENGIELLGQVPLEAIVREGGDAGAPVVMGSPESLTGRAFRHLADRVAMRLAIDAAKKPRKPTLMLRTVR